MGMKLEKIFYLHIPKTGGQTLASRLASSYRDDRVDILGSALEYPDGVEDLKSKLKNKDFIECHVSGPVLSAFNNLNVLATVRNPIDQIISTYYHIKREEGNYLYNPAVSLSVQEFFANYGDMLANTQTMYLISSFYEVTFNSFNNRDLCTLLFKAAERVKWLVPSEKIDEFTDVFSLDYKRNIPLNNFSRNVANNKVDYDLMYKIINGLPELYSLDLLLWQLSNERFKAYKDEVRQRILGKKFQDNSSKIYTEAKGFGIWLGSGWYPKQPYMNGYSVWAGPNQYSEVLFKRDKHSKNIRFEIIVVCGVLHNLILVVNEDKSSLLNANLEQTSDNVWSLEIDLSNQPLEGKLFLRVPVVYSSGMMNKSSKDFRRMSFATSNWSFSE